MVWYIFEKFFQEFNILVKQDRKNHPLCFGEFSLRRKTNNQRSHVMGH